MLSVVCSSGSDKLKSSRAGVLYCSTLKSRLLLLWLVDYATSRQLHFESPGLLATFSHDE